MTRIKVWHAAHGPAHVAAHPSGREYAPRRAAVRAALSVLLLALVLLSSPTDAFAASNPSVVYSDDGLYVVAPCNNGFDAALATIGLYSVRPRLTAEMRTKLSNASTGGAFYELAARFQQQNNTLEGFGNAVYIGILTYNTALYGAGNIMQATGVTSSDIANAKRDFNVIQNGGSLGGGGGGGSGEYFVLTDLEFGVSVGAFTDVTSIRVAKDIWSSEVLSKLESCDKAFLSIQLSGTTSGAYPNGLNFRGGKGDCVITHSSTAYVLKNEVDSYRVASQFSGERLGYSVENGVLTVTKYTANSTAQTALSENGPYSSVSYYRQYLSGSSATTYDKRNICGLVSGGTGSGGGDLTDNWPDDYLTGRPIETEPVVPTPPVYDPITYTNPTDDPLPTPPPEIPVTPVNPIVTTDPTNTTPQDYTPWLSAILTELRNFHRDVIGLGNNMMDALATHCTHITTTIMDETEWLYDQLKAQIRAGVQAILNGLDQNCTEMMNYLEDLAEWLADQLQFTFNIDNSNNVDVPAYDDSSVIGWLKRIYNAVRNIKGPRIGTPVTEKDVEDGFDWWAWILSLLDQLFDNVISQTVGEVESFLDEFRNLFPLSIPWDVVAILTMFAGTPTTPEVTLTFPAIASLGLPEYDLVIDLEPFDNAAYTIRQSEQIVFAFYLLFKTQWLLDTLKSATDAAGEFVEGLLT